MEPTSSIITYGLIHFIHVTCELVIRFTKIDLSTLYQKIKDHTQVMENHILNLDLIWHGNSGEIVIQWHGWSYYGFLIPFNSTELCIWKGFKLILLWFSYYSYFKFWPSNSELNKLGTQMTNNIVTAIL